MHRIDSSTAEEDTHGAGKDGFTAGDPGGGTPPTQLTDDWFNDVQEELANVIEGNGITLVKGTVTQLLSAVRSPVGPAGLPAITATGGTSSGTGIRTIGGGSNGIGLKAEGTGTGAAIHAVGLSGYGVIAESDTTSPARAALKIVPQDANPTTAEDGAMVVRTNTKRPRIYTGAQWSKLLGQDGETTSDSSAVTSTSETAFSQTFTIPANTLVGGSTIRIRAGIKVTGTASGGNTVKYKLRIGSGVSGTLIAELGSASSGGGFARDGGGADQFLQLEGFITVRGATNPASVVGTAKALYSFWESSGLYKMGWTSAGTETINPTIANDVVVTAQNASSAGSASTVLQYLIVDIG